MDTIEATSLVPALVRNR